MSQIFRPHPYQKYNIMRCISDPAVALFLEMGLGKTVISLTAINDLRYNRLAISKCLIIAPKKVAEATWTDERDRWEHLKHLRINLVLGSQKQRIKALATPGDIWVINRDNVQWLVDYYKTAWPFDMVVIDELSSFKAHNTRRFSSLKAIRPKIKRIIGLTGTPAPNSYIDLWAQIYLLDQGERLEKYITHYRERYFYYLDKKHSYELKPGAADVIEDKIRDICVSMRSEDYLKMPDCITNDIPVVLDLKAKKEYRKFQEKAVLPVIEEEEQKGYITAASAVALSTKLLQFCGGAVYDEDGNALTVHGCKMEAFEELIEGLNGRPALVFYAYKHERDRILSLLAKKFKGLRVAELKDKESQAAWNNREVDVLLAHPASAAYGLNLQQGGNHIIWFTLTWSAELYQQANARLHRQGQSQTVIVHRLLVKGGRDEDVAAALEDKADTQNTLMESLKAIVREVKERLA